MTADIELLPLPEASERNPFIGHPCYFGSQMQDYARANMEPLIAEIEALRAEVATWEGLHASEVQVRQRWQARAERLAEALREIERLMPDQAGPAWIAKTIASAALHDHDQEAHND